MEHNRKSFPAFNEKIKSSNVIAYEAAANKFAIWLAHHKAYYSEARPFIVQILESAHSNICTVQGNPSEPFSLQKVTPQLERWQKPYIAMLKVAATHFYMFHEPELKQRLMELLRGAGIDPVLRLPVLTQIAHQIINPQASTSHALAASPSSLVATAVTPQNQRIVHSDLGTSGTLLDSVVHSGHVTPMSSNATAVQTPSSSIRASPLTFQNPVTPSTGPSGSTKKKRKRKRDLTFTDFMQVDLEWYKKKQTGEIASTVLGDPGHVEPQTPSVKTPLEADTLAGTGPDEVMDSKIAKTNEPKHVQASEPVLAEEVSTAEIDTITDQSIEPISVPPVNGEVRTPDDIGNKVADEQIANESSNRDTNEKNANSVEHTLTMSSAAFPQDSEREIVDTSADSIVPVVSEVTCSHDREAKDSLTSEQGNQGADIAQTIVYDDTSEGRPKPEVVVGGESQTDVENATDVHPTEPVLLATIVPDPVLLSNISSVTEAEGIPEHSTAGQPQVINISKEATKQLDEAGRQAEVVPDEQFPATTPPVPNQVSSQNADSHEPPQTDSVKLSTDMDTNHNAEPTLKTGSVPHSADDNAPDSNNVLGILSGDALTVTVALSKRPRSVEDDEKELPVKHKVRRVDSPNVSTRERNSTSSGTDDSRGESTSKPEAAVNRRRRGKRSRNKKATISRIGLESTRRVSSPPSPPCAGEVRRSISLSNSGDMVLDNDDDIYHSHPPALSGGGGPVSKEPLANNVGSTVPSSNVEPTETGGDAVVVNAFTAGMLESTPPTNMDLPVWTSLKREASDMSSERDELMDDPDIIPPTPVFQTIDSVTSAVSEVVASPPPLSHSFYATEIRSLLVARGSPNPGDEIFSFYMDMNQITRIAKWRNRTDDQSDLSETLCLSLACYRFEDAFSLIGDEEISTAKEVTRFDKLVSKSGVRCCWPSSAHAWIIINDDRKCGVHMPPYLRTADDFVDISSSARCGTNTVQIHHQTHLASLHERANLSIHWKGLMQKMSAIPQLPKLNLDTGFMDVW